MGFVQRARPLTWNPTVTASASGTTEVLAADANSDRVVAFVLFSNGHASTAVRVGLKIDSGSEFATAYLRAGGGGFAGNLSGAEILVPRGSTLYVNLGSTGTVYVTVAYQTVV
jgi:hypothetical protein